MATKPSITYPTESAPSGEECLADLDEGIKGIRALATAIRLRDGDKVLVNSIWALTEDMEQHVRVLFQEMEDEFKASKKSKPDAKAE